MLKILFAGTPECAIPSLRIIAKTHILVGVLTNPPAAQGRSSQIRSSPVALATRRLIEEKLISETTPILDPEKILQSTRDTIAALKPDLMVCFAYGKIFSAKTLDLFPLGAINIHPSLLPRWRGCAPVPAAILARDAETGISIQKMALAMDEGDILAVQKIPLTGTETTEGLLATSAELAANLLQETLQKIEDGTIEPQKQDGSKASYCGMLCKENGEICWEQSAHEIDAHIRAFYPWPGTFTHANDKTLIIHKAHPLQNITEQTKAKPGTVLGLDKKEGLLVQTGAGVLALEILQWQTKKPLDFKAFFNGSQNIIGTQLQKAQKGTQE